VAVGGIIGFGVLAAVGFVVLSGGGTQTVGGATVWATLGTRDVHSLAFDPSDAQHLYFGHHNGLLESRDGGRTWQPTALSGADAMNVRTGTGPALQIAGHNVYMETADGGRTWTDVPNDLPGLDLHAFVVDPTDPSHTWAWAVGFGLFESTDRGRHWEPRQPGDWPVLAIVKSSGSTTLVGVSAHNAVNVTTRNGHTSVSAPQSADVHNSESMLVLGGVGIHEAGITFGRNTALSWDDVRANLAGAFIPLEVCLYFGLLVGLTGQTPGMMVIGLKVVTTNFSKPGILQSLWRYALGLVLSWIIIPLSPFSRIYLHDKLSGTRIIKTERVLARARAT
jgi:hypothetical protein